MADSPKAQVLFERIRSLAKFPDENPSPVLRVRAEGRVVYANDAARTLLAVWRIGVGEEVPEDIQAKLDEAGRNSHTVRTQVTVDGTVYILNIIPIKNEKYLNMYAHPSRNTELLTTLGDIVTLATKLSAEVEDASIKGQLEQLTAAANKALGLAD